MEIGTWVSYMEYVYIIVLLMLRGSAQDGDETQESEIPPSILWLIFCFVCIVLGICLIFCKIVEWRGKTVRRNTNGGQPDALPYNRNRNTVSHPPPHPPPEENNTDDPWRPPDYDSVTSNGSVKEADDDPPPPYPGI